MRCGRGESEAWRARPLIKRKPRWQNHRPRYPLEWSPACLPKLCVAELLDQTAAFYQFQLHRYGEAIQYLHQRGLPAARCPPLMSGRNIVPQPSRFRHPDHHSDRRRRNPSSGKERAFESLSCCAAITHLPLSVSVPPEAFSVTAAPKPPPASAPSGPNHSLTPSLFF